MIGSALLKLTRPRFWLYTAGPYLLGYMAGTVPPHNLFTLQFWLGFLYFLLPANLLLYGVNDLFDRDSDALNPKKGDKEQRLESDMMALLRGLVLIVLALSGLIFVLLSDWPLRVMFLAFVLLSIFYSAPPVRFKGRPFLDSYSNVLYVVPAYLGYFQTAGHWLPTGLMVAGALWAAGMHAISAIPDIEPDRHTGINTVAVFLGERGTLIFVTSNWLGFALLVFSGLGGLAVLAFVYPALSGALFMARRLSIQRIYWWFPALNAAVGFVVFLAIMAS